MENASGLVDTTTQFNLLIGGVLDNCGLLAGLNGANSKVPIVASLIRDCRKVKKTNKEKKKPKLGWLGRND